MTGGSARIGRAIAVAFGREGARVALTYRERADDARGTAQAVTQVGGSAVVAPLDLGDPAGIGPAAAVIERDLGGGIDVLVNNAVAWPERAPGVPFEAIPLDAIRASAEANLVGHYALSQAVVGSMRQRRWDRIVDVSTGLVEDGFPARRPTRPRPACTGSRARCRASWPAPASTRTS